MSRIAGDDVRALFACHGIVSETADDAVDLVIDRFDHWRDQSGAQVRSTGPTWIGEEVLLAA